LTRVLHIVSGDLWAGAEVQVAQLLRALARDASMQVAAFALNDGELVRRLRAAGITTHCADESKHGFLELLRRLLRSFDELKPQLVHSHRYKEHVLAMALRVLRPGARLVRTVHGAPETAIAAYDLRRQLIRLLDQVCARHEEACIAVSRDLAARLAATLKPRRLELIPNSVDLDQLDHELESARVAQARMSPASRRVGLIGRLVPVKRVDLFLDAAERIAARRGDVEFLVIGDGPLRTELTKRMSGSPLQQRVQFTGAVQPVAPLMSTLDVLAITSDHEGLPSVLLEALALRVAVVARAVGGIPEVVAHGESALLVDGADAGAIAAGIERILDDESLRASLTAQGRRLVVAAYSSQQSAQRHRRLYESIAGEACGTQARVASDQRSSS
jgi:glycosyltransferase involved in cell wall biosynthesis